MRKCEKERQLKRQTESTTARACGGVQTRPPRRGSECQARSPRAPSVRRDPLSVRTRPPSVDRRPCQFLNVGHIILREIQFLSFVFFSFSLPFDLILTVWLLWVDRRSSLFHFSSVFPFLSSYTRIQTDTCTRHTYIHSHK